MAPKKPHSKEKRVLLYPRGVVAPEDFLVFIQWDWFVDDWKALGLTDDDLRAVELLIMVRPEGAPIIGGTGGVRKLRFAPAGWGVGKSSGVRVWYLYLKDHCKAVLLVAYDKSERDNLTASEKSIIKSLVEKIEAALDAKDAKNVNKAKDR